MKRLLLTNISLLTLFFMLCFTFSVWSVGGTSWEPGEVLYVGGETIRTIKMYNATDLTYMNVESLSYGGDIYSMFEKDGVIYIGGAFTNKVRMYNATTLQYIRESPDYGGYIRTMFEKDGVIYVGGTVTQKVRMYNATTLQYMNVESPSYGGVIRTILEKDGVIYVGGTVTQKVRMYNATTLQYMNVESPSYGGDILTMLEKDGVIYVGGYTQKVRMYNATTLQYIRESPNYGNINSMLEKDGVIYVSGDTRTIRMYNATTLQYMNVESPNHGSGISCIIEKDGVIYVGGGGKIKMYNATTLEYMNIESPSYGKNVFTMVLKNEESSIEIVKEDDMPIYIISPTNQPYLSNTVLLNITAYNHTNIIYNYNGYNLTYTKPINLTLPYGKHSIHVWATRATFVNHSVVSFELVDTTIQSTRITPLTINDYDLIHHTNFPLSYSLQNFNTNFNCSLYINKKHIYTKSNLVNDNILFDITPNYVDKGENTLTLLCREGSTSYQNTIHITTTSESQSKTIISLFYFLSFILCFISIFFFKPLGLINHIKQLTPIIYGMLSLCFSSFLLLSLNDLNMWYYSYNYLYFISIFLNLGNVLLSIPDYINVKLSELKSSKIFGNDKRKRL